MNQIVMFDAEAKSVRGYRPPAAGVAQDMMVSQKEQCLNAEGGKIAVWVRTTKDTLKQQMVLRGPSEYALRVALRFRYDFLVMTEPPKHTVF